MTELVNSALKHAFPDHRIGAVALAFAAANEGWTLSVKGDGVCMETDSMPVTAGLGTNIVEALARHLDADISIGKSAPGTKVSSTHVSSSAQREQALLGPL